MSGVASSKLSRLTWVGHIPTRWDERRAKFFFRAVDERSKTGAEELLSVSHITGVTPRSEKNVTMFKAESYEGQKLCQADDLVINSLWAWMGALGVSKTHGIVSSAYGVYRRRDEDTLYPGYVNFLLRIKGYAGEYLCRSTGIWISRLLLTPNEFLDIPILAPPLAEQQRIAEYLDEATGKIDRLMSLRRRQMELLREQRAALIQQAVTRGLNFKAALREVELGWVDQIPEHWRTSKLRRVTSGIGDGLHGTPVYVDQSPYFFVNGNNLVDGAIQIFPETRCVSEAEYRRLVLPLGDRTVLMSINGTLGNVALFKGEPVVLGKSAAYLNCSKEIERSFLYYVFQTGGAANFLQREATGTTILNLSLEAIRNFRVVLPPPEEQSAIVRYIEAETAKLDGMHQGYERQLALLAEYRAALIHECVTGQRAVPA